MPLKKGSSRATISHNIGEMEAAGHPRDQAVAAALSTARRARAYGGPLGSPMPMAPSKMGGKQTVQTGGAMGPDLLQKLTALTGGVGSAGSMPKAPLGPGGRPLSGAPGRTAFAEGGSARKTKLHVGPIHSPVAGRTDHLPMHVPSGSYVIPADIVSAMGEGNTIAGFKHLRRMFSGAPYGQGSAPYGQTGGPYGQGSAPYGQDAGPYGEHIGRAEGGKTPVAIVAAGGEHVLTPAEVAFAGGGDLDMGHRVLDEFVKRMRAETVKTLKKLPGPRRD